MENLIKIKKIHKPRLSSENHQQKTSDLRGFQEWMSLDVCDPQSQPTHQALLGCWRSVSNISMWGKLFIPLTYERMSQEMKSKWLGSMGYFTYL